MLLFFSFSLFCDIVYLQTVLMPHNKSTSWTVFCVVLVMQHTVTFLKQDKEKKLHKNSKKEVT